MVGFVCPQSHPFFRLPSLHTFKGCVCHEPEDNFFTGCHCPERSSAVTVLTFQHSAIYLLALKSTILTRAHLEHFACDWAGTVVGWVEVNFPLLRQALWEQAPRSRPPVWTRGGTLIPGQNMKMGFCRHWGRC